MDEINAEVKAYRAERRARHPTRSPKETPSSYLE